jgi:uncharacterized protein (DUF1778 family)
MILGATDKHLALYAGLACNASAIEGQMHAFHNPADAIDEPNEARMQFRTKPRVKDAIQRAAALVGVDDSAFMISAAYSSALATIAAHEETRLRADDHYAFLSALDNPPEPAPGLRAAFERYRSRTRSDA